MENLKVWLVTSYLEVGKVIQDMMRIIAPEATVIIFGSPLEARRMMEIRDTELPGMILCDQLFKSADDMEGGDFLMWVRETFLAIYTIHMSSSLAPHQSAGNAFLSKPFQFDDLKKVLLGSGYVKEKAVQIRGGAIMTSKVVMLVDDDPILREVLKKALEKLGLTVHDYAEPGDALLALRIITTIDYFVADFGYSGQSLNGWDIVAIAARARKDIEIFVVISDRREAGEEIKETLKYVYFLAKPHLSNTQSIRDFAQDLLDIFVRGGKVC